MENQQDRIEVGAFSSLKLDILAILESDEADLGEHA